MDKFDLAVIHGPEGKHHQWVVFTINGARIVGVDCSCTSFREIYQKYGFVRLCTADRLTAATG